MKRLLIPVLASVLTAACTSGHPTAVPGVSPSPSAAVADSTPTPTPTPARAPVRPVPRGFEPLSVSFVSDRTGWVMGCATSCDHDDAPLAVIETRDGGRTWRSVGAPAVSHSEVTGLRFANLRDGFALGTHLWSTHDGGLTWHVEAGQERVAALEIAHGTVWALTGDGAAGTFYGLLRRRPVAGGAWTDVVHTTSHFEDVTPDLAVHGDVVYVVSSGDGDQQRLLVAADGRAFRSRSLPCKGDDESSATYAVLTDSKVLLVCHRGDGNASQEPKVAYLSRDQGRTWTRLADVAQLFPTLVSGTATAGFVANRRYLDRYDVARSRWATTYDAGDLGMIDAVAFEGPRMGLLFVEHDRRTLLVSHDDGRTWHRVDFRRTASS